MEHSKDATPTEPSEAKSPFTASECLAAASEVLSDETPDDGVSAGSEDATPASEKATHVEPEIEPSQEATDLEPSSVPSDQEPDGIEAALIQLTDEIRSLKEQLSVKDQQNAEKQVIIDRLHRENEAFQNGLLDSLKEVYLREFISLQDAIEKNAEDLAAKPAEELGVDKLIGVIAGIADDIEDRLFNLEVTTIEAKSDDFDPRLQKVLIKEDTEDPEKDKQVAGVVRRGYIWNERVLRPQLVKIFTHKKA